MADRFIVLKFGGSETKRAWSEIQCLDGYWEAEDASAAFHKAVLSNKCGKLNTTSYLVFPRDNPRDKWRFVQCVRQCGFY